MKVPEKQFSISSRESEKGVKEILEINQRNKMPNTWKKDKKEPVGIKTINVIAQ